MDFRYLLIDHDHGICRIRLNRPERLNAINIRVGLELLQAFETCDYDEAVRVVILTGGGPGLLCRRRPQGHGRTRPTGAQIRRHS